jgi:hypothetical protein
MAKPVRARIMTSLVIAECVVTAENDHRGDF